MYESHFEKFLEARTGGFRAYAEECRQTMMSKHLRFHRMELTMHPVVVLMKVPGIFGEEIRFVRFMMRAPADVTVIGERDALCEYFKTANLNWHLDHTYGETNLNWIRKLKWRTKTVTENRLEKVENMGSVLAGVSVWRIVKSDTPIQVLDLSDKQINRVLVKLGAEILDIEKYGGYDGHKLENDFECVHDMFEHTRFPRHLRVQYHKQQIEKRKAEQKFMRSIWRKHGASMKSE